MQKALSLLYLYNQSSFSSLNRDDVSLCGTLGGKNDAHSISNLEGRGLSELSVISSSTFLLIKVIYDVLNVIK